MVHSDKNDIEIPGDGETLLELVLECTGDGILVGHRDGTFSYANRRFAEMWNIPDESMSNGDRSELHKIVRDQLVDSESFFQELEELYESREKHSSLVQLKDGRIFERYSEPMMSEGVVVGRAWSFRDITDRQQAKEELRTKTEKQALLLETMDAQVWYLTDIDTYGELNRAHAEFLGVSREAIRNRDLAVFLPLRVADVCRAGNRKVFERGQKIETEEWVPNADGEDRLLAISKTPKLDDQGKVQFVVCVATDITERERTRKELEETLKELKITQEQVIEQERHRALTQMASGIAHDFNNALSTITGFTDLMLQVPEKLGNRDTVRQYLERISKAASNAAETVRRMRKFYRPAEEEPQKPIDVNRVVKESLSMTRPRWRDEARAQEASVKVEQEFEDEVVVLGNEAEMQEMLANLIFNAVDAMPDGGTLSFRTRQEKEKGKSLLEVSDTGVGMSEEVRKQCLTPFYTTKGEDGTGLGLSVVQGIIRRHGGNISISSEKREGTTFHIRLPLADSLNIETESSIKKAEKPAPLKILVVEDEKEQRIMLKEYLEVDEHEVNVAPNGRAALEMFMDGWYDLVITDRSMPEIGGDCLAREIKQKAPDKPVIMLTGFGEMMEAAGEKPEGVDLILSKPVSSDELRNAMAVALSKGDGD